jgi:hypothetical protein
MEKVTEIVDEPRLPIRRNLTPKQKKSASLLGRINSMAHQDEGFDEVDIVIIVEECMRNVDQQSGFAFRDVVSDGKRYF